MKLFNRKKLELVKSKNLFYNDCLLEKLNPTVGDIQEIYKTGTKFRIIGDSDPWYVVNTVLDKDKLLVVYKGWNNYKRYWVYKIKEWHMLLHEISLLEELYITADQKLVIKDNKKLAKKKS